MNMKKILEVLQYGEGDIRFDTDIDVAKNPQKAKDIIIKCVMAIKTEHFQKIDPSAMEMICALAIADLACSVNRKEMIGILDHDSSQFKQIVDEGLKIAGQMLGRRNNLPGTVN